MEESDKSVNELFICKCHNIEHQLVFSYFPEDEDKESICFCSSNSRVETVEEDLDGNKIHLWL